MKYFSTRYFNYFFQRMKNTCDYLIIERAIGMLHNRLVPENVNFLYNFKSMSQRKKSTASRFQDNNSRYD